MSREIKHAGTFFRGPLCGEKSTGSAFAVGRQFVSCLRCLKMLDTASQKQAGEVAWNSLTVCEQDAMRRIAAANPGGISLEVLNALGQEGEIEWTVEDGRALPHFTLKGDLAMRCFRSGGMA